MAEPLVEPRKRLVRSLNPSGVRDRCPPSLEPGKGFVAFNDLAAQAWNTIVSIHDALEGAVTDRPVLFVSRFGITIRMDNRQWAKVRGAAITEISIFRRRNPNGSRPSLRSLSLYAACQFPSACR